MYHVVARTNRKEFLLNSSEIKEMFLAVVVRGKKRFHFDLTNFCVMSNHFHFLIIPGNGENLSKIMQWILSVFAVRYNKRFGWCGHVWYDRFKSRIVEGLNQFLHAFRYIAENPLRAGLARYAWDFAYNGISSIKKKDFHLLKEPEEVLKLMEPALCEPFLLP